VQGAQAHLLHLNPERVLDRGYSITETADGAIVRDSAQLAADQELKVTLARGWAGVRVKRTG
jgi:exodeoxyribonuclease VII large subunit